MKTDSSESSNPEEAKALGSSDTNGAVEKHRSGNCSEVSDGMGDWSISLGCVTETLFKGI